MPRNANSHPAQEVPLLPEHQAYRSLVSIEGPASSQLTEKASLLSGRERRDPQPCHAPRGPELSHSGWGLSFCDQASIGRVEKVTTGWGGAASTAIYLRLGVKASPPLPSWWEGVRQRNSNYTLSKYT